MILILGILVLDGKYVCMHGVGANVWMFSCSVFGQRKVLSKPS